MRVPGEDTEFEVARKRMVQEQLRGGGIRDERVLAAMSVVPRHFFVEPRFREEAYEDHPVPLASCQTVSQPLMVASMLEALRLQQDHRVLEVGTGTGYEAALLALLAKRVVTVERIAALANTARELLRQLELENVEVVEGDGTAGYEPSAPYDRIIVAAAAREVPRALIDQLADGGILVIPVGADDVQVLKRITANGDRLETEELMLCRFVPLIAGSSRSE